MVKRRRAPESESSARNQTKPTPSVRAELTEDLAAVLQPTDGSVAVGNENLEAQVALLSHPQLRASQRHALIAQVGRVQGNRHVQRLVASL
jgi:hypothetical protein